MYEFLEKMAAKKQRNVGTDLAAGGIGALAATGIGAGTYLGGKKLNQRVMQLSNIENGMRQYTNPNALGRLANVFNGKGRAKALEGLKAERTKVRRNPLVVPYSTIRGKAAPLLEKHPKISDAISKALAGKNKYYSLGALAVLGALGGYGISRANSHRSRT